MPKTGPNSKKRSMNRERVIQHRMNGKYQAVGARTFAEYARTMGATIHAPTKDRDAP